MSKTFLKNENSKRSWPQVPKLYGWLYLNRRGKWLIKREQVKHLGMIKFLKENYKKNTKGEWYIENGPQKAFVTLEYTPLIIRLSHNGSLTTNIDTEIETPNSITLDDEGNVLFESSIGLGLLDDRDMYQFSELVDEDISTVNKIYWKGLVLPVRHIPRSKIPAFYKFSQCKESC